MDTLHKIVLFAFLGINLIAFITFGVDKMKAMRGNWRISEKNLFIFALIGGGVGCILGMLIWRHKIRKWYFVVGIPLIIILEAIVFIYLNNLFSN